MQAIDGDHGHLKTSTRAHGLRISRLLVSCMVSGHHCAFIPSLSSAEHYLKRAFLGVARSSAMEACAPAKASVSAKVTLFLLAGVLRLLF